MRRKSKNVKTKTTEKPLSTLAKDFADAFERLASDYEDEDFGEDFFKAMKGLAITAGSLVSMALDGGFFAEYRNSLETEYKYGLEESENEGWQRLWLKLIEILRLRRGLSILDGTFSENCRIVVSELQKEAAETKPDIGPGKWCKAWTCIKKIPKWIYILVLFLAALFTIFHYLGWL